MSFLRTLVLAVVAAALGAWLWMVEAPRMEEQAKADVLLDFDPGRVAKVRLSYPDGSGIGLAREEGAWKLTSPVVYAAEKGMVENFLTTVKEARIERRIGRDEAGDASTYGLDSETGRQGRLELTLDDGTVLPAVRVGIATPVGFQAFVSRAGSDEVLVVSLLLHSSVRKTPLELRRKSLFDADAGDAVRVSIAGPGRTIDLARGEDGDWKMLAPLADDADDDAVSAMLASVASIDATGFFDGDSADRAAFGLVEDATRFVATRADGSTLAFALGREAPDPPAGIYFERKADSQVAKVPDWVATKFAPATDELRGRRFLSCRADEVLSIEWTVGEERFTLSRTAAGAPWSVSPLAEGEGVNQRMADNVLRALAEAKADAVAGDAAQDSDLARFGLDAPSARVVVKGADRACASLVAAPVPGAAAAPTIGDAGKAWHVKDATRSAVLKASSFQYSRLATRRAELVEAAKPAPAP